MEANDILGAITVGIGATLLTDLWNLFLKRAFGLGIAASKTPNPTQARLKSLATHTVYGVGLWLCAMGVRYVIQVQG